MPAPTTVMRSPTRGAASHSTFTAVSTAPASTARRAGTPSGTTVTADSGTTNDRLMREQREHRAASQVVGAVLDDADVQVAVLDGSGEVALLERRAHALVLARGNLAAEDDRLGAAADAGVDRAHEHLTGLRMPELRGAEGPATGRLHPECRRLRHCGVPPD